MHSSGNICIFIFIELKNIGMKMKNRDERIERLSIDKTMALISCLRISNTGILSVSSLPKTAWVTAIQIFITPRKWQNQNYQLASQRPI